MNEPQVNPTAPRPPALPPAGARRAAPTASRMFARYLNDIGQLLDERHWEAASREAHDLPRIAVALADAQLRSSAAEITNWCQQWIRPPGADGDAHGLDHERICLGVSERVTRGDVAESSSLTMRALRRLRLRRHVRNPPRGFSPARADNLGPQDSAMLRSCEALLEAARRWYARSAVHDPTVQANLARLAVLR
jgi:hypothetical protein